VELGAIESSILSSPLVDNAAVLVLTRLSGEKQLVACLSLQRPTKDAEPQLRGWLRVRLSRASIPQHWIFFEHLPININGKLDRNALRSKCEALLLTSVPSSSQAASPAIQQVNAAGGELLDASEIMSYLQQLWASLIGRPSVGIDETFFDIGGTSVLLIEMHARLRTQFAATPSLVDMFAFPTPRLLAARLLTGREAGTQSQQAEQRGQRQRTAMLARRTTPVKSGADGGQ
jgi:hypothetical protein